MRSDGEGNGRFEKIEKEGKPEGSRFEYCYVLITSRTLSFVSTPILFFALFAFVTLLLMYATGSSQAINELVLWNYDGLATRSDNPLIRKERGGYVHQPGPPILRAIELRRELNWRLVCNLFTGSQSQHHG